MTLPPEDDWNHQFADPLRALTREDVRTCSLARGLLPGVSAVRELAKRYDRALGGPRPLSSLADPFVLCATDLAFGVNWEFKRAKVGDYQAGYIEPPPDWSIGLAVAASSCFPPLFQPLKVPCDLGTWQGGKAKGESPENWASAIKDLRLSDGGVYDNLGLEPVWKDHAHILVSDAGGIFDFQADKGLFPWRVKRYQSVQERQVRALRKRWLIGSFKQDLICGAYWGTGSSRSRYDVGDSLGYSKILARDVISEVRTDLDSFSDVEAAVLENHGYFLADVAVRTHCARIATVLDAPLKPPHPAWVPESGGGDQIRVALKKSHRRMILGRGWSSKVRR
jgi:NTE family protein